MNEYHTPADPTLDPQPSPATPSPSVAPTLVPLKVSPQAIGVASAHKSLSGTVIIGPNSIEIFDQLASEPLKD